MEKGAHVACDEGGYVACDGGGDVACDGGRYVAYDEEGVWPSLSWDRTCGLVWRWICGL